MLTVILYSMLVNCLVPEVNSTPPHWSFSMSVGNWDPGQRASNSYMTIEDGRAIQETVSKMHQNTILLKNQESRNVMWDNITRVAGVLGAGIVLVITIYRKISGMKKLIPSIRGQHEMTVLPTTMRHY